LNIRRGDPRSPMLRMYRPERANKSVISARLAVSGPYA
jgi:hypothetical protein